MSEQQPELRWAPIPPKPRNRGRIWLIVGLSVLAVAIVGVVLWFLLFRGGGEPSPTPSPTASTTATATATPSSTSSPSSAPEPSAEPEPSAPPVESPDLAVFAERVTPRLDDADRGLDMLSEGFADVVNQLRDDAMRLTDEIPPSAIADAWGSQVASYLASLDILASTLESGGNATSDISDSRAEVDALRSLVSG